MEQNLEKKMAEALQILGLSAPGHVLQSWYKYLCLLEKWNKSFNLTSLKNMDDMLVRHLFDSLTLAPLISSKKLEDKTALDIGAGAGLPGLPLAILFPQMQWSLLDSNGKKTRFMRNVAMELSLANVQVIQDRVEYSRGEFDLITTRAFATINNTLALTKKVFLKGSLLIAMKGIYPHEEIEKIQGAKEIKLKVEKVEVPFLNEDRHLVLLKKV